MAAKEKLLLYVSPAIPAPFGNGRAMRAYNVLKRLSGFHQIHLLIISREVQNKKNYRICEKVYDLCETIKCIPIEPQWDLPLLLRIRLFKFSRRLYYFVYPSLEDLYCSPKMVRTLESLYQGIEFDIVHVFRIYMMGLARRYVSYEAGQMLQLDMDDIESRTHHRLGDLYSLNHDAVQAQRMHLDADRYQKLEEKVLGEADRIFVCSDEDKRWLTEKYHQANIHVLPNIVQFPQKIRPRCHLDDCYRFLFIGSFGYYPNEDGMLYFCRDILPLIRAHAAKPFEVRVVGTGLTKDLIAAFSATPNVDVVGAVADISPQYFQADAMIIPVRAGGGTRIKVLEAFAHRCPIVSTSMGVEGIAGKHDEHFLSADTDAGFAENCLRLMNDSLVGQRLASNAYQLVKKRYTFDALAAFS